MTTETIATLEELEREARRSPFAWASSGPVTVYDVDTSTSPNLTRPGYLYRVYGEFVSRDEAAIYAHQCGPLCTQHGDVRDHGAIAL